MKIRFLRSVLHHGNHVEAGTVMDVPTQAGINLVAARAAETCPELEREPEAVVNHDPSVEQRDPQIEPIAKRRGRPPKTNQ